MKRALRVDKIRLAAIEATLKLYRDPDRLAERLPTLRLLARPRRDRRLRRGVFCPHVRHAVGEPSPSSVCECESQIGSGALPLETIPSAGLAITSNGGGSALEQLAAALRGLPRPVIGQIDDGALILDLRCLTDEAAFLSVLNDTRPQRLGPNPRPGNAADKADDRRHRRPYRSRQDGAGQSADRRRWRPAEGRKGARHHDRSRLCLSADADGQMLGFIDVPGHERFVHTMLAGASGIDFALLTVAADDGVKPQTLEHLAILDLLGISRGVVALTKADLAIARAPRRSRRGQIKSADRGDGVRAAPTSWPSRR